MEKKQRPTQNATESGTDEPTPGGSGGNPKDGLSYSGNGPKPPSKK